MSCTDFPSSGLIPNVTTHTVGNITYIWTGIAWESQVNVPAGPSLTNIRSYTLFEAQNLATAVSGQRLRISDKGSNLYKYVPINDGTANGYNIIECFGSISSLLLVQIPSELVNVKRVGAGIDYIAHRGMSRIAPENTIPAFEAAGKAGFWGAECDVQLTSDGVWVIMHDDTVDRTTDGTGNVDALTYSYIQTLDAGTWFNEYYAGTLVPTLEEYLIVCRKFSMYPMVEIKSSGTYSNEKIKELLNLCIKYFPNRNFEVMSFNTGIITQVRSLDSSVYLSKVNIGVYNADVDLCLSLGRCGIVSAGSGLIDSTAYAIENNIELSGWTINNFNYLDERIIPNGASRVITDYINI